MIGTLLLAAAIPLFQSAGETEKLKVEISFAEDLARYAYFDLAAGVLDALADDVGRDGDGDLAGELLFVKARAAKSESERALDLERRTDARQRAIDLYSDFSKDGSEFSFHPRLLDALEDLAQLHRGRADDYARRGRAGESELLLLAVDDYKAADEAYERFGDEAADIAEQLEGNDKADASLQMRERGAVSLYLRGLNGIDWSKVAEDPAFRLEEAISHLDDFLWEVDEGKLLYLLANFEQARAYATLADYTTDAEEAEESREYAREILQEGILNEQNLKGYWNEIGTGAYSASDVAAVASLFDKTWAYMAELEAGAGDLDAAQTWIDTMRDEHARLDVPYGSEGLRALISWSVTLTDLGRTQEATNILRFVASPDGGRGTPEGTEADIALKDLVASEGLGEIHSVDVLMSVGSGHAKEGEYGDAAFAYLRAAALISTPEEATNFTYDAYIGAGDALRQEKRQLEAGLAYDYALEYLLAEAPTDLVEIEKAAYKISGAYGAHYAETKDPADKDLRTAANERLQSIPGVELDVQWAKATEALAEIKSDDPDKEQKFLAALAEFEAVPENSANYERAIVYGGRCLEGAGRYEDALAAWARMRARAEDSSLNPTAANARVKREAALALARYDAAALLLSDEVNRPDEALTLLENFEEDLPGQADLHSYAKYQRVIAHAHLGELLKAEDALDVLQSEVSKDDLVYRGAYEVATALQTAAEASEGAERREAFSRAAQAMTVYNETRGYVSFDNGRSAGLWHLEADEPAEAEAVFRALLEVHESKGTDGRRIDSAKVGLATALDRQQDYARARPLWKELQARNPNDIEIKRGAALSFGGWMQADEAGNVSEIPGSGDYADAYTLWGELYAVARANYRYQELWWECKVGSIYTAYRLAPEQPDMARESRQILDQLKLSFPTYDRDVHERIDDPAARFEPRFHILLRYLERKVPTS